MSLVESINGIAYLADNLDKPMVYCKSCGNLPTVDDGKQIIRCRECQKILIAREPVQKSRSTYETQDGIRELHIDHFE